MHHIIFLLLVPIVLSEKKICPGGSFSCPDDATCCELTDKSYGCCPIRDAVCCSDHIHCCPPTTQCSGGTCIQPDNSSTIVAHNLHNVLCPDGEVCPNDTTCCRNNKTGAYDCCPMKSAVCCGDGVHCCPSGTRCNVREGKCEGDLYTSLMYDSRKGMPKSKPYSLLLKSEKLSNVICPDNIFQCPDAYTCCQLPKGNWGCCPFASATCCTDHVHCCPQYMKCDATSTYCSQGSIKMRAKEHVNATEIVEDIVCPDKTHCHDGMTCCQLAGHKFGCCQYPNATCCSDQQHCCPSGFDCDTRRKKCIPRSGLPLSRYFDSSENEI